MALDQGKRARIILDIIKDGNVENGAAYNSVDLSTVAVMKKYSEAFAAEYGKKWYDNATPPVERAPTNDELAEFLISKIKQYVREIFRANKVNTAAATAGITAGSTADTEAQTDLG